MAFINTSVKNKHNITCSLAGMQAGRQADRQASPGGGLLLASRGAAPAWWKAEAASCRMGAEAWWLPEG